MNLLFIKIWVICWLIRPNQANLTSTSCDNETLLLINKMRNTPDVLYYISGGKREPDSVKFIKHVVSIRTRNPHKYFGDNHFCAGIIISKKAVLTSAHCVMDKRRVITRSRRLLIVAGTPNRLEPFETTVQLPVKSITANSNFIRNNKNDIAIIRLKKEIPENNSNIKILELPTGPPVYNASCTIIGWGRMLMKGPLAALPLHVNVRLYHPSECKSRLGEYYYEGFLCAGNTKERDQDPCRGDTGGPLICNGVFTGIISWTLGCGTKRLPSLYTDVWYHMKWIENHLNRAFLPISRHIYMFVILAIEFFILN